MGGKGQLKIRVYSQVVWTMEPTTKRTNDNTVKSLHGIIRLKCVQETTRL